MPARCLETKPHPATETAALYRQNQEATKDQQNPLPSQHPPSKSNKNSTTRRVNRHGKAKITVAFNLASEIGVD